MINNSIWNKGLPQKACLRSAKKDQEDKNRSITEKYYMKMEIVERHASIGINVRLFSPSSEQKTTRYDRDFTLLPEYNRFSSTA